MPVVVEITDQWNRDTHINEPPGNLRHCPSGFFVVDGNADETAPSSRKLLDLKSRTRGIRSVGVCHRLDNDGIGGPNRDATDHDRCCPPSSYCRQFRLRVMILKANSLPMAPHTKNALLLPAFWSTDV
jgi:hypothetical protein